MISLLDQLTAVAAGLFVLMALLTIQTRDRAAAVERTVSDVAQSQVASAADVLAQEFDNALSEQMAVAELGAYRCSLTRDTAGEMTTVVDLPVYVRAVRGGPVRAANVRYQLVSSGRTVAVGAVQKPVYRLTRQVDAGTAATVAEGIVDFDVKFRGRAFETFAGGPPLRFSQIAFQIVVAGQPPRPMPGRARTRQTNTARAVFTIRPPNLTPTA